MTSRAAWLTASLAAMVACMLGSTTVTHGGNPIDLTGEWTAVVQGDADLTCTAAVEQTGLDVVADLSCLGALPTTLEGDFDPGSRELHLDLRGECCLDIELSGTVSPDGNEVVGTWEWGSGDVMGTVHATRGIQPPAVPDLSGTWNVDTGAGPTGDCTGELVQNGVEIELSLQCPGQPEATLTGEVENRLMVLMGDPFGLMYGPVSEDGQAIGAAWFADPPSNDRGPFIGLKAAGRTFEGDATGDWSATLSGFVPVSCDVGAEQDGEELFVAFDCGPAGGWWMRGMIDTDTSTFDVSGKAGPEREYAVRVRGIINEDGESFTGAFEASRHTSGSWSGFGGTLAGTQVDTTPDFLDMAGEYEVTLKSRLGEEVPCDLNIEQTQEVAAANADCEGVGQGDLDGWVSPLTGAFQLEGPLGDVHVILEGTHSENRFFALTGTWTSNRRFVDGCFNIVGGERCVVAGGAPGDANCNRQTNSVDAALILQYSAGLVAIQEIPCSSNVYDLRLECCPVVLNALDAAIILQLDAGLLGRLAG